MEQLKTIFPREAIQSRVEELAAAISEDYGGKTEPVVAICVLKGAFVFFADLIRELRFGPELDFVRLASYGKETSRGEKVVFTKDIEVSIANKHVLIVEDIVDTGNTVDYLARVLRTRNPKSVKICALVHKISRREVPVHIDFYGFKLTEGFIVGYGLDYAEQYRNLPNICELACS